MIIRKYQTSDEKAGFTVRHSATFSLHSLMIEKQRSPT